MPHRSRKQKQHFPCGHRGLGQYCHCCAAKLASRKAKKAAIKKAKRAAPKKSKPVLIPPPLRPAAASDAIDLSHLPKPIALKARKILAALEQGTGYWQLGGRRLSVVLEVIRIPVTYRYRLLCWEDNGQIIPWRVLSHEDYNPLVRSKRRLAHLRFSRGSGRG